MNWNDPVRDDAYWADLRRKANENLLRIGRGEYRKEPREPKKSELERATADEIQSGFIVLEARRLRKELNSLLLRSELKEPELGYAEELQCQLDDYDAALETYCDHELRRFVRLWNKSRKAKYSMKGVKLP